MNFDFFSLDYIYYPVSGIMWIWHKVFGFFLGANNAWAWVLSVVFLVFTLRSLLFKPFMKQMNSQMKMQAVAPELKKLREKYKDDKTRLAEEMQKFNKEAGVNPLGGCLPALVQAPVFIGLFHVLRSFKPGQQNVYFFGAADVNSFVEAKLFGGAPLSAYITMPWVSTAKQVGLGPDGLNGVRSTVIAVAIPIIILASIATHMTSRRSVARQKQMQIGQEANPQSAIMNKVMLYLFPLGVLVTGPFFPIAIIIYYLSNNTWTFGQLYVAHRIQDKKIAAESMVVEEAREASRYSKPQPGAKPAPRSRPAPVARPAAGSKPAPGARPAPGSKPAPGARPAAGSKPVPGAKTSGVKRRVVQPSSRSANGATQPPAAGQSSGAADGATIGASNGTANGSGPSLSKSAPTAKSTPAGSTDTVNSPTTTGPTTNGSSGNGAVNGVNGATTNGGTTKGANGPNGGQPAAAGSNGSQRKPTQTTAKKKKPGRR